MAVGSRTLQHTHLGVCPELVLTHTRPRHELQTNQDSAAGVCMRLRCTESMLQSVACSGAITELTRISQGSLVYVKRMQRSARISGGVGLWTSDSTASPAAGSWRDDTDLALSVSEVPVVDDGQCHLLPQTTICGNQAPNGCRLFAEQCLRGTIHSRMSTQTSACTPGN